MYFFLRYTKGCTLHILKDGFKFKIGNGETSLWYYSWVEKVPLFNRVLYVHYQDLYFRIKDIVDANSWNLGSLYTILDSDTKQKISSLKPLLVGDMPDVWVWESVIFGTYTIKDVYKWLLDPSRLHLYHISWSWIWRFKVPPNVHFFLWELCHNSNSCLCVFQEEEYDCLRCVSNLWWH